MKILLDHNVDRRFRRHLPGHVILTTREQGWERLANGVLLRTAAEAGFDVFISVDKNLRYQQNLKTLPLAVVVIDSSSNALPTLVQFVPAMIDLLTLPLDRLLYIIQEDGSILRLGDSQQ